jgi:hypothetical protein
MFEDSFWLYSSLSVLSSVGLGWDRCGHLADLFSKYVLPFY